MKRLAFGGGVRILSILKWIEGKRDWCYSIVDLIWI